MLIELKDLMLRPQPLTLAVAESLTCGQVQARLGEISGASTFFLGGMTAYTLEQKVRHLGVDPKMAKPVNSVSAEVAEQMARGACLLFDSDLGLATTGYAEPSPEWQVPAPFAWWAMAHREERGRFVFRSGCTECPGLPRHQVQVLLADAALTGLIAYLRELRGQ